MFLIEFKTENNKRNINNIEKKQIKLNVIVLNHLID